MEEMIGYVEGLHRTNLPLYAVITVAVVILTAMTLGGLTTRLLEFLGAPAREGKEVV